MGMPATDRGWTREEVLDLIARNPLTTPRYELVDGVLLVTPASRGVHQFAVGVDVPCFATTSTASPAWAKR
jgi:hypothetical protein